MPGKKTMYHGELRDLGPVRVTVNSDVMKSKFQGKPDWVALAINGEERNYNLENPGCGEVFRGQKGRTLTIVADGSREEATVTYVGESGATVPPPQQRAPVTPAAPTAPPRAAAPTQHQAPPTQVAHGGTDPVKEARKFVARRLSLMKITLKATSSLFNEAKATGFEMDTELFQAINSSLFISADRAGIADQLPTNLDYATLTAPAKPAPPPPPPPAPSKCKTCGTELLENGECPKCDDLPM